MNEPHAMNSYGFADLNSNELLAVDGGEPVADALTLAGGSMCVAVGYLLCFVGVASLSWFTIGLAATIASSGVGMIYNVVGK